MKMERHFDSLGRRVRYKHGGEILHKNEWNSWRAMKQRCLYKGYARFDRYGGRGIKICDRWLGRDGFVNFYKDMGDKPTAKHSLDRVNNDGDYTPENCRWSDQKTQVNNSTNVKLYTIDGIRMNMTDHIKRAGVSASLVYTRMRSGCSFEEAIKLPNDGIKNYRINRKRKYIGKRLANIIVMKRCGVCDSKCSSYKKFYCSVVCSNIGRKYNHA